MPDSILVPVEPTERVAVTTQGGRELVYDRVAGGVAPARARWIKIPTFLVPTLARPANLDELQEWVVGSFLATYWSQHDTSPTMAHLKQLTGLGESQLRRVLARMKAKGWLGMARTRNEYQPGHFGIKWRFWITAGSPLRDIMGRTSQPWVPVPTSVARSKSPIAVAAFLALHEQQRIDGAITTTPTDLAALLLCSPRTARRQMVALGCEPVGTPVPGCAVYTLNLQPRAGDVVVRHTVGARHSFVATVRDQRVGDALCARADELVRLAERSGLAPRVVELLDELPADTDLRVVLRLVEDRYRTRLVLDGGYRRRLWQRFSARLRHAKLDRAVVAAHADRRAFEQERDAALQALASTCGTCSGLHLVEQDDGTWQACARCT